MAHPTIAEYTNFVVKAHGHADK